MIINYTVLYTPISFSITGIQALIVEYVKRNNKFPTDCLLHPTVANMAELLPLAEAYRGIKFTMVTNLPENTYVLGEAEFELSNKNKNVGFDMTSL